MMEDLIPILAAEADAATPGSIHRRKVSELLALIAFARAPS
jgi:hypothetical protein